MRWSGSGISVVVVAAGVVAGGCGAEGDGSAGGLRPTVTDSAGVEIVTNRVPPAGLPVYATLDSVRDLNVGYVLGDDTSYLSDVKDAVSLSDGGVAVANGSTYEIRYYGPDGTWLGWMGRQGLDDGEYWELSRLGRAGGDTLWAADYSRGRLTVFEREAGVIAVSELPAGYSVVGRFGDGSFLLVPRWRMAFHESDPMDEVRRDPARYLRFRPQDGDTTAVGDFVHDQILVVDTDRGLSVGVPPFGRQTVRAVGPGRFYVGDQEDFVIGGYDPDGTLRQSIRLEGLDLSVSPEQIEAARAGGSAAEGGSEVADRFWATVPDTRPAYGRILLDAAGNLWVAEHVATAGPPRNWLVFAADGAIRGVVSVPPDLVLKEVGVRHVLGVVKGRGGDERVVRYRMTPSR